MERAEKIGLGVATAGHVLLFGLLSAGFLATPNPLKLNSPPMDVSLVDEAALQSAAPQISTQPPPPSVAPDAGPTEDAAPAPAPEPAPVPEPEPTPAPPPPKPAPAKKEVAKVQPKPKPAPEKPAAKPTPSKMKPAPAASKATQKPAAKAKPNARASGQGKAEKPRGSLLGKDFLKGINTETDAPRKAAPPPAATMGPAQKAALDRLIGDQIYRHLKLPSGADVEQLVAFLEVKIDRNGRVIGRPEVIDVQGQTASNKPQVSIYKERAVQAVLQASPFQGLPDEYYEQWKWLKPLRVYARKAR